MDPTKVSVLHSPACGIAKMLFAIHKFHKYRCFIRNISSVADPINALTSPVRNYGVDISELLAVKHAFCMTKMSSGLLIVESLEPFPLHPVV